MSHLHGLTTQINRASNCVLARYLCLSLFSVACLTACSAWPWQKAETDRRKSYQPAQAQPVKVADDAQRAQVRLELATAYFEQGQTEVASQELAQSLKLDPRNAESHNLQGLIALRLNQPEQAEQSLRRALALDADNAEIQHNYGYVLCQMQRYSQAQQRFDLVLANARYSDSGREKTLLVSALCQVRAGQLLTAEATLRSLLERQPVHLAATYHLADVLYRQHNYLEARRYIRLINNSDNADASSLLLGVRVEQALGHAQAQQQLLEQLRRRFPDSPELRMYDSGTIEDRI